MKLMPNYQRNWISGNYFEVQVPFGGRMRSFLFNKGTSDQEIHDSIEWTLQELREGRVPLSSTPPKYRHEA